MAIKLTEKFTVAPKQEWLGTLFVTDADILLRQEVANACEILGFGYDEDDCKTHVITHLSAQEATTTLADVFAAYARMCSTKRLTHVYVRYYPNDGRDFYDSFDDHSVVSSEYGFADRGERMRINVYCGVPKEQAEEFLGKLLFSLEGGDPVIIVRPDDSATGYSARGFIAAEAYEAYDG